MRRKRLLMAVAAAVLLVVPLGARGEPGHAAGWWRIEVGGGTGLAAGSSRDRTGDMLLTGFAEYELPIHPRATLGFRLMPLFVYDQDEPGRETVWGGGLGLAARLYPFSTTCRGWYGEIEGHALGHQNQVNGNDSNLNFLIGAGIGYRFANDWHGLVKFEHISNASLEEQNSGANTLGAGIGYSF